MAISKELNDKLLAMDLKQIEEARDFICWPHDGPLTRFVIISRACRAIKDGTYKQEIVAEALHEALFGGVARAQFSEDLGE
jgi:hypothetical protein